MKILPEKLSGRHRWLGMMFVLGLTLILNGQTAWAKLDSSASSQKLYASAKKEYRTLLHSKSKMKQRQNWIRAISRFQKVLKQHPKTQESYKSTFTLGRLYHRLGKRSGRSADIDQALAYYHRLKKKYPAGWLTDDSLYFAGELHLARKHYAKARASFQEIVTRHPKADFVPKAKRQLKSKVLKSRKKSPARSAATVAKKSASPSSVELKDLTFVSGTRETRVVLKVQGKVTYSKKRLSDPDRIYFDFNHAQWAEHLPSHIPVDDGRVQQLRITNSPGAPSRLVLDLEEQAEIEVGVQVLKNQLIIVIPQPRAKQVATKAKSPKKSRATLAQGRQAPRKPVKVNVKTPVVVLDAGHGGKDYGARGRGARGIREKDLNLDISKLVKKILVNRYKYKVIMTRKNDTFIELKDRGKIANKHHADIFVSIHANAAKRKSARGIETYYLGSGSSAQARETAERENGELVHSVSDGAVQDILASLISTTKINDSSRLAARVQKRLHKTMSKKFKGVHDLGVKEGPFFVLHDTNMPSILVEVGFVTNRKEGLQLRRLIYQKWLAESIALGIHDYLKEKAPSI